MAIDFSYPCLSHAVEEEVHKKITKPKYSYITVKVDYSPLPIMTNSNIIVDVAQAIASFASLGVLLFLLWQGIILQRQTKDLEFSIKSATYQSLVQTYTDINKTLVVDPKIAKSLRSLMMIRYQIIKLLNYSGNGLVGGF